MKTSKCGFAEQKVSSKYVVVQTTCSTKKEAKKIADILLKKSLAACVHISKIESVYVWEGKLCNDKEILLSIKTKKRNFKKIKSKIKENHSYDLPEILELPITNGSKEYLKWMKENSRI